MEARGVQPGWIDGSVTLYRRLVRLYPRAFRDEYAELMVQVFRDTCLHAGAGGLAGVWGRTLLDYILSVMEQYIKRGAVMTKSRWIQLSGWLLAASGVTFFLGMLAGSRPNYSPYNFESWQVDRYLNIAEAPLVIAGLLMMALGLTGLAVRYWQPAAGIGRVGLAATLPGAFTALAGYVGMLLVNSGPWWETLMSGITVMFLGLAMFGWTSLRKKLFARWNFLPLVTSIPWPVMVALSLGLNWINGQPLVMPDSAIFALFFVSFIGISLLGFRVQTEMALSPAAV